MATQFATTDVVMIVGQGDTDNGVQANSFNYYSAITPRSKRFVCIEGGGHGLPNDTRTTILLNGQTAITREFDSSNFVRSNPIVSDPPSQ